MHDWEFAEFERRHEAMLRSHVERCLQDIWGVPELVVDEDGDYHFRHGTAACWVSLDGTAGDGVRVIANAAVGLKPSARLLREVNDLNVGARWVRVTLNRGIVHVSRELHWTAVERMPLQQAIHGVGSVADHIGLLLASVHGGQTPFPAQPTEQDSATDEGAA